MPAVDEHMLTITLSPQVIGHHRIKGQLKLTYRHIKDAEITPGKGCMEFTKQGNVHYHIKTQDNMPNVYILLDKLKGISTQINGKKVPVFGFTKCDKTTSECQVGVYDYLEKDIDITSSTLKKLQLLDKYHVMWEYKEKQQRFNADCTLAIKRCVGCLDKLIDNDSDTQNIINEIICV